ncbi:MAG: CDF family Co(II)/Ni(II) efflux transporter DmeF [Burkholderiales bacterium]|nr:CDF family Co(II)/Ni(II) efflux transporter DmeF [Burkholderiales bacterium]
MHTHDHARWRHEHVFDTGNAAGERGTRWVLWITLLAMVAEITAGWWFNSMALLADGFHMSSHALAIGLSVLAYGAARKHARDPRFAFGTWKIEVLGGFASAVLLLGVAALMAWASIERLLEPAPIRYREALLVAMLGLAVNLVSARILGAAHHHGHDPGHGHDHPHAHDLNLKSAYVHVLTDAATSVAAIVALAGGWWLGWAWLDPAMGIAGAVVIAFWARGLIVDTGKVLLDREMDHPVVDEIRDVIATRGAAGDTLITDLHVWRVGRATYACALTLVTHDDALTPATVRDWLAVHEEIVHSTIEIHRCPEG